MQSTFDIAGLEMTHNYMHVEGSYVINGSMLKALRTSSLYDVEDGP